MPPTPHTHHDCVVSLSTGLPGFTYVLAAVAAYPEISGMTGEYDPATGFYYECVDMTGANGDHLGTHRSVRVYPTMSLTVLLEEATSTVQPVAEDVIDGTGAWADSGSRRADCRAFDLILEHKGTTLKRRGSKHDFREIRVTKRDIKPTENGTQIVIEAKVLGGIFRSTT